MNGKVVVITGGTSGIGQVAAEKLAAMGARIVLVARDKARVEAALASLRGIAPGVAPSAYFADLSRIDAVKQVAREIAAAEPRVDVLINNAGAMFYDRQVTADGLERTFATNHMAYFLLTLGLRESLKAAAPARVISTSSEAHRRGKLDFDDLQCAKNYRAFTAYGNSKLCNILFTRELSRHWTGTGITANCLHPGFVNTRFGDGGHGALSAVFSIAKNFALTPEQGAKTIVYLASSREVADVSGEYFIKCARATPTKTAQDDNLGRRLWEETAKLAGEESARI
jgi:NAD(P)-dependent dehydrogenase (short-subunit alcohol dehydrogenase family)